MMRIAIVEDEIPAQRLLSKYLIELVPDAEIVAVLGSVKESINWFHENRDPDILFLDVQLGDGMGFEILEKVRTESLIVYTTAYDQYAVKAFESNAVDYLLKPLKLKDLKRCLGQLEQKTKLLRRLFDVNPIDNVFKETNSQNTSKRKHFLLEQKGAWYTLSVEKIAYFYIDDNATYACEFNGKRHVILESLGQIMLGLDKSDYYRVNRQFVVHIRAIEKVENWFRGKLVVVTSPKHHSRITVGRDKSVSFRQWLNQ
ncbi:LytTR family DNA-binding domain-containing protein [Halosquirtibacter laminarini]|uniref:LytTR family DNA-binding domain-containing protein n=1 Tax=Halosquirtibacter laminarini TaxID=3374600 RepID=A0AC61NGW6_9BACT|nr:LytTR family DNA-binding domain-containing protein [Prolixibacteraceae bacterium]